MADEWTTCEACGLEYMGAHRCRARGSGPLDVVAKVIVDPTVAGDWLICDRHDAAGEWPGSHLTADECAELSAAFGAIARRLREAGR